MPSLCELECACSPAPWHRAIPPLPPTRTCVCVCVFLLTTVPVAAANRAETPLAARLWQRGKGGSEGGRWGSWWGFKGFLHSWALFVTEHNPALHFNKSTEVKKLHSGENKMDVDWLSFSLCLMGSVDLCPHVSARLPTVLKCSVSQFILP